MCWGGGPGFRPWVLRSPSTALVYNQVVSYYTGTWLIPTSVYNRLVAAVDNSSVAAKAYAKARDAVLSSDFNAGVAIGELGETIDSVSSLARGLWRGFRSLKHGDPAGAFRHFSRGLSGAANHSYFKDKLAVRNRALNDKRRLSRSIAQRKRISAEMLRNKQRSLRVGADSTLALDDVSSTWLAMQYGWLPLMGDLHALCALLDSKLDSQVASVVATHSRKVTVSDETATSWGPSGLTGGQVWRAYFPPSTVRNTEKYTVTIKRTPRLIDRLGITNPSSIVWELVPFSFVFDWFIPVGDWLENRSLIPFIDSTMWKSSHWFFQSKVQDYKLLPDGFEAKALIVGGWGSNWWKTSGSRRIIDFRRSSVGSSPTIPSVKQLGKALSLPHLENAAALLHQIFRS